MINFYEVNETQQMIEHENLDVRTITLGISLLDCIDSNLDKLNQKVYEKITTVAFFQRYLPAGSGYLRQLFFRVLPSH